MDNVSFPAEQIIFITYFVIINEREVQRYPALNFSLEPEQLNRESAYLEPHS